MDLHAALLVLFDVALIVSPDANAGLSLFLASTHVNLRHLSLYPRVRAFPPARPHGLTNARMVFLRLLSEGNAHNVPHVCIQYLALQIPEDMLDLIAEWIFDGPFPLFGRGVAIKRGIKPYAFARRLSGRRL